ncbi:MAPEG family protein [Alcanivorax sp. S6407]|uniref:MAPEG family protein n=1 Tax=Alcanivorax sp. S6407 TaxID=2926424 RepID=UPI001FF64874|nr:MAPEG family protein [Alcanivorax sp. S6407]MCK0155389.1 MAPEG family protein [Alcanivorax sp. S6407]
MPTILYVLFAISFLPIFLAWVGVYFRIKQFRHFDNYHPRQQQAALEGAGARTQAAQANAWEALIVFTMVCFIAYASGLDLNRLDGVALLYLATRLLHPVLYIANLAWLRSGVFAVGMGCCLYIVYLAASQ